MNKIEAFLLSLNILIPIITGVIRYRNIPVSYLPLALLLVAGLINEIISFFLFSNTSNAFSTNIYFLIEFYMFIWLFRNWKNILRYNFLYKSLLIILTLIWVYENIILQRIFMYGPLFQISYSLVLILLAVDQLNWLVVNEKGRIILNSRFIICIAVIIYFSYKILIEIFYYYAPSDLSKSNIFEIQSYLNVGYNILLTIAILCIPPKINFIQLSR